MFLSSADAVDLYGKRFQAVSDFEIVWVLKANNLPFSYRTLTESIFNIAIEDGDSYSDLAEKVRKAGDNNRAFFANSFLILKKRFAVKSKKFNLNIRYGYVVDFDISSFENEEDLLDLLEFLLRDNSPFLEGLKERVCFSIRETTTRLREKIAYQSALLERNEFNLALSDLRDNYEISQSQKKILEENLDSLSDQDKDLLNQVDTYEVF